MIAVELHPRRAQYLHEHFPDATIVAADAREMPWPRRPFRVVANPAYGMSTPLLRTLLAPNSRLIAADLVLQRAVVRRYTERPPGRWRTRTGLILPRSAFRPVPQVDSAVLVVRKR